jgi:NADH:ubiquinone oxidoreductase subunit E
MPAARRLQGLHHLEHKLGIKMGETTADGLFTLQQSSAWAPAPIRP